MMQPVAMAVEAVWRSRNFRFEGRVHGTKRLTAIVLTTSAIWSRRTDDLFRNRTDLTHLGLAGHSLGGYTALGLRGAWPSRKLSGVKAILALSPYAQPFIDRRTLSSLSTPVMFQGGARALSDEAPVLGLVDARFDESRR